MYILNYDSWLVLCCMYPQNVSNRAHAQNQGFCKEFSLWKEFATWSLHCKTRGENVQQKMEAAEL